VSAIAGLADFDERPIDAFHLRCMLDTLKHRGPDDSGIWVDGAVGLAHHMLWTTPESLVEHLPYVKGHLAITADARIDNRDELISTLGLTRDQPITDSELILAAYETWSDRCPERLLGDFAFAIWDGYHRQLFCARDPFGLKPFYYHWSGQRFLFASEIKALLSHPDVPRQLNQSRIADYLLQIFADQTTTFYQGIVRLPPAHTLNVSPQGLQISAYWALDATKELRLRSDQDYAEAYRELFTDAVRCRLRSAYPVGSMLSGGLDSSSIVCVAQSLLNQPLKTFSIIFDQISESDERPFINAVLDGRNVEPYFIPGDSLPLLGCQPTVLHYQDEPFDAPNLFLNRGIWAIAQQQGVRVLLDGLMGDDVVSHGYAYLNDLAYQGHWIALARQIHAIAHRRGYSPWEPTWRYIWNEGIKPRVPHAFRNKWRQLRGYDSISMTHLPRFIQPQLAQDLKLIERLQAIEIACAPHHHTARDIHRANLTDGFLAAALEVFNKGSAEFGLETRLPFSDRRLVEFCLAIPPNQKLYQGWPRSIARRGLNRTLPDVIQWRDTKGDLSYNLVHTLNTEQNHLEELLCSETLQQLELYLSAPAVSDLVQKFLGGGSEKSTHQLLLIATLAQWLTSRS
jgi:asparagine synthase (glutamine-hydrolysing)